MRKILIFMILALITAYSNNSYAASGDRVYDRCDKAWKDSYFDVDHNKGC